MRRMSRTSGSTRSRTSAWRWRTVRVVAEAGRQQRAREAILGRHREAGRRRAGGPVLRAGPGPGPATGVVHETQAGVGDGPATGAQPPWERASPTTTATDTAYAGIS